MIWERTCLFIFLSLAVSMVHGQLPTTQIYTLDLRANEEKALVSNVKYLSSFNPLGYNNQPSFIDRETLLITTNFNASGLTDVYQMDLATNQLTRITATEESEYSPTMMPDGINFSVIRQEVTDAKSIPQVLWSYPIDRSSGGDVEIDLTTIGYHSWLSPTEVALFLVGDPHELVIYNTETKKTSHVAYDVGRALKTDKKGDLYYVHKIASSWNIRKYSRSLERSSLVVRAIPEQEDFDILPNGFLISSEGSMLKTLRPGVDRGWQDLIDLKAAGINKISRIASTSNKIAIVTAQ